MLNKFTGIKLLILSALFLSNDTKATCFGLFGETTSAQPTRPALTEDAQKQSDKRTELLDQDTELADKEGNALVFLSNEFKRCSRARREILLKTKSVNPEQFASYGLITEECHTKYLRGLEALLPRAKALADTEKPDKDGRLQHSTLLSGIAMLLEIRLDSFIYLIKKLAFY